MSAQATRGRAAGAARLPTGVAGLDTMLFGGIRAGDSTLVVGSPGTGKTTLGLHFIAAGVERGEPGVFVTFEYLPQQLYEDAERHGIPLRAWEEAGRAKVLCTTPEVLVMPTDEGSLLQEAVAEIGAKRVVVDSMAQFQHGGSDRDRLRGEVAGILNHMRLLGVTALLTHEAPQIISPIVTLSEWGLEFLVDNVVMLRYVELGGELDKAISVLKFRAGGHDRRYHRVTLGDRGMSVEAGFEDVENISVGSARRSMSQRVKELV
ncbi:MAG: circadian clock protein KaiC [Thermoplasmata archaeon]|jgi:circadian clock protein KaiC|nr:circadian clock protein KaiC [Thermoplasmata archaeon]